MTYQRLTLAALIIGLLFASPTSAAMSSYRLVSGTLVSPKELLNQPQAEIRGDDGVNYVATLERRSGAALTDQGPRPKAGDRVSVLGIEGARKGQLLDARIETISADAAGQASPAPAADLPTGTLTSDLARIAVIGSVQSVAASTVTVRTPDGRTVTVDVSQLDKGIRRDLRAGDAITLYVPDGVQGTPVAQGVIVGRKTTRTSLRPSRP